MWRRQYAPMTSIRRHFANASTPPITSASANPTSAHILLPENYGEGISKRFACSGRRRAAQGVTGAVGGPHSITGQRVDGHEVFRAYGVTGSSSEARPPL
ncbi:hypothetical protein GCK32_006556 [Trichostrongylus colubriformis]|uniref:Uncharacterized protein n=1 Tax=Trichostrongylus colubriformis TaxID=6319 RepID=A0AAN8F741_TRICO